MKAANIIKGIITTIIGIVLIGIASKIMYEAGEITFNGILLVLLGLIAFGLPDPSWKRILQILKIQKKDEV
jgi:hypothetical protein